MLTLTDDKLLKFVLIWGKSCVVFVWGEKLGCPRTLFIILLVQEVANNRQAGDADKEKALLAEVFKLLGNSAYGKFFEAVEHQMRTLYTKDKDEVDKQLRSAWFEDLEAIGDAYKIECRKPKVKIKRPVQVGIVVYQLAKLRMLEFYYDFLDYFLDRRDCTSPWRTTSWRRPSSRSAGRSSSSERRSGCRGTSGATGSPACSSLRRKAPGPSRCAASATS